MYQKSNSGLAELLKAVLNPILLKMISHFFIIGNCFKNYMLYKRYNFVILIVDLLVFACKTYCKGFWMHVLAKNLGLAGLYQALYFYVKERALFMLDFYVLCLEWLMFVSISIKYRAWIPRLTKL